MIKFLDLNKQYQTIKSEIDASIQTTIAKSAFIGGVSVEEFETAFGGYQQASHCIGVANGTDALEIAIEALELSASSEIIVPANTFIASSEAVTRSGHRVVFADVDPVTYTLDPADVKRRITDRTRAIVAVHLYGHPCDMASLLTIARSHDLKLVEDCAQAHGAEYRGQRLGAIGDIGAFSFYPGKNLGAYGDAGAIVTNSSILANKCRMIANHGRIDKYDHLIEGRNSRLDGLQAAILNVKLKYLDSWIERRSAIALRYCSGLSDVEGLALPSVNVDVRHAFHLFVVRVRDRDGLKAHLSARGIETGVHYPIALPKLAAYAYLRQASESTFANTMAEEVLSLPMGEHLTDIEVDIVIDAVKTHFQ